MGIHEKGSVDVVICDLGMTTQFNDTILEDVFTKVRTLLLA